MAKRLGSAKVDSVSKESAPSSSSHQSTLPTESSFPPTIHDTMSTTTTTASLYSTDRRSKSWTKSLKKATSSILYMAMPPTSAEHLPMVVAQTPMSPDRLPPSLLSSAPIISPSSLSVASSSSSAQERLSQELKITSIAPLSSNPSPIISPPLEPSVRSAKGKGKEEGKNAVNEKGRKPLKEKATPVLADVRAKDTLATVESRSMPLTSPPSLAPSQRSASKAEHSLTAVTITAATTETLQVEDTPKGVPETFPSPPPSPTRLRTSPPAAPYPSKDSQHSSVSGQKLKQEEQSPPAQLTTPIHSREVTGVDHGKTGQGLLPMFPADLSAFDISLEEEKDHREQVSAVNGSKALDAGEMGPSLTGARKEKDPIQISGLPLASDVVGEKILDHVLTRSPVSIADPVDLPSELKVSDIQFHSVDLGILPNPTPSMSNTDRKQKTRSMVVDASGFPIIPTRSLSLARSRSRSRSRALRQPRPVQNSPWIWHQDGIHHQRLESHQILTKEQVFEQFHLDLDQDGPNGFFLFKLVKRFKRQDSSLLGISSNLLGAELSASPTSSPVLSSSSPSILDSIDANSVSQKLKRQLLLQKQKKQRKSGGHGGEEEENLEALLTMSGNNGSLQNLNSSLQEVIDAVDSLKGSQEWTDLLENEPSLNPANISSYGRPQPTQPSNPDSDGEYTSRDKDAMDTAALEKKRGVYATGRMDGMNLISKKRLKALERRASTQAVGRKASGLGSTAESGSQDGSGIETSLTGQQQQQQQFRKQAKMQLHIYSRNGLKIKFDVMPDNELHFVEASKKYTFMDPLAAHRQPDLDSGVIAGAGQTDVLSPLRSSALTGPGAGPNSRRQSSSTVATVASASTVTESGRPRRSNSSRTQSSSGSGSGRRVFVTRLGRHTLLTYTEYKILAKSASGFTLGAKLLIQRSIAVATPNFYGSSSASNGGSNGHGKDAQDSGNQVASTPAPTPSNGSGEPSDYFSVKKKQRSLPGFSSKAAKTPSTPSPATPATPAATPGVPTKSSRPIVTPYNPAEYKNNALRVSIHQGGTNSEETPVSPTFASGVDLSSSVQDSMMGSFSSSPPTHSSVLSSSPPTAMSPIAAAGASSSTGSLASPTSSLANPYTSPSIKRHGNQAGLKFQQLFATVHQRLQKLELDSGTSFYGSALVQWTVIEDPAELRWWRDKIGIQMIGRLEGDELLAASYSFSATGHSAKSGVASRVSGPGSMSVRSSYVTAQSQISSTTLTGSSSSSSSSSVSTPFSSAPLPIPYKSQVSVERLGYRFLRVSGHMGTLKVTVSEQVEARAVALAVRAEVLKQQRAQQASQGLPIDGGLEQPWMEMIIPESDDETESDVDENKEDDESDSDIEGGSAEERSRQRALRHQQRQQQQQPQAQSCISAPVSPSSPHFYDLYEYDEWTGRTCLKKTPMQDKFSRRRRHDRRAAAQEVGGGGGAPLEGMERQPLIERMTMIVGQAKVFKGDWYMKNIYKFDV